MNESEKRPVGRPSKPDRKQRINVTLSPETLAALEEKVALKQRSAFIEQLIRQALGLPQ
jgi:metal-responsive CopG/Arc/MetJ family transcriptional regulator